jgi:hypothetical protein
MAFIYLKQTTEKYTSDLKIMHISSVVHIWSKKTKNTNDQCIPSFPLKPFADILLITKQIIIFKFSISFVVLS